MVALISHNDTIYTLYALRLCTFQVEFVKLSTEFRPQGDILRKRRDLDMRLRLNTLVDSLHQVQTDGSGIATTR
ncbi:hypothetical protein ACRALDRAFT_1064400 [Sodiomyces alcalophilus JCM 7366]|uniref:uncharacterized protein n=1 Tax=Sodiomyces alcalophilus JCM 7366 TaxID=591952 RepID=UPI0039B60094